MGYGLGGNRGFMDFSQKYGDQSIGALSKMEAGYTREVTREKTAGGGLQSALGTGLAGMEVAPMVSGAMGLGGGAAAGAVAGGTMAATPVVAGGLTSAGAATYAATAGVGAMAPGAAGGAASGAAAGSGAGPWGFAIGAILGLAAYYLS